MRQRVETTPSRLTPYDYVGDQRYQQWREEREEVKQTLRIHWVDTIIICHTLGLVYLARVCTTAGLFYGVGRTASLYRTIDKLNGDAVGNIAIYDVSVSAWKAAAMAAAGMTGMLAGNGASNVLAVAWTGAVGMPDRSWRHVAGAMTASAAASGATLALLQWHLLTTWDMRAVIGGFTAVGAVVGLYVGHVLYRLFVATREHALYDPH